MKLSRVVPLTDETMLANAIVQLCNVQCAIVQCEGRKGRRERERERVQTEPHRATGLGLGLGLGLEG